MIQIHGKALKDILNGQPQAAVDAIFHNVPLVKINGEDSGLMLFANAKFRFLPLPDPVFKWGSGSGQSVGLRCNPQKPVGSMTYYSPTPISV